MCPSCERGYLQPTGSLFVCDLCGLALTQQTIDMIRVYAPSLALLDLPARDWDLDLEEILAALG